MCSSVRNTIQANFCRVVCKHGYLTAQIHKNPFAEECFYCFNCRSLSSQIFGFFFFLINITRLPQVMYAKELCVFWERRRENKSKATFFFLNQNQPDIADNLMSSFGLVLTLCVLLELLPTDSTAALTNSAGNCG